MENRCIIVFVHDNISRVEMFWNVEKYGTRRGEVETIDIQNYTNIFLFAESLPLKLFKWWKSLKDVLDHQIFTLDIYWWNIVDIIISMLLLYKTKIVLMCHLSVFFFCNCKFSCFLRVPEYSLQYTCFDKCFQ